MNDPKGCLEKLKKDPEEFGAAIRDISESQLSKRPDEKNWAPKEIICHVRDTEELFLSRFVCILAMEEPKLFPAEVERWAVERQYLRNDPREALAAFRQRRQDTLRFLQELKPDQWGRVGIHSKYGPMTIQKIVELMVSHGNDHLAQLQRALAGKP